MTTKASPGHVEERKKNNYHAVLDVFIYLSFADRVLELAAAANNKGRMFNAMLPSSASSSP
jgi:hypothetical protein